MADYSKLMQHAEAVLEDGKRVLVLEKDNCPQCMATKRRLAKNGVEFQAEPFTSVTLPLAMEAGFVSAPVVIVIGYGAWCGFKPGEVDEACRTL